MTSLTLCCFLDALKGFVLEGVLLHALKLPDSQLPFVFGLFGEAAAEVRFLVLSLISKLRLVPDEPFFFGGSPFFLAITYFLRFTASIAFKRSDFALVSFALSDCREALSYILLA